MKKLLLVFVICAMSLPLLAQISVGPTLGLNFAKQTIEGGGIKIKSNGVTGIVLGAEAELPINDGIFLNTGLLLSIKGATYNDGTEEDKIKLSYLEIPIKGIYKAEVGGVSIYGSAGFYVGFGIGGEWQYTDSEYPEDNESESIQWGSATNDDFKGFDFGFGIGGGLIFDLNDRPMKAGFVYDLGLSNIEPITGGTIKNKTFSIRLTYSLFKI